MREAFRPSLITQHINFQSRKKWQKSKEIKKSFKDKLRRQNQLGMDNYYQPDNHEQSYLETSSQSSSSFESLEIAY